MITNKNTRNDYETRFLLQSRSRSRSPHSPKASRVLKLLGGEDSLDFLSIYISERIAGDKVLGELYYKNLNTKSLVQLQKELLQLALSDDLAELTKGPKKNIYNQNILQKHARLGLIENEENFDRLAVYLADALQACQIKDTELIFKIQRRFSALKPLLQVTREHMEFQVESIRFPILGKLVCKK